MAKKRKGHPGSKAETEKAKSNGSSRKGLRTASSDDDFAKFFTQTSPGKAIITAPILRPTLKQASAEALDSFRPNQAAGSSKKRRKVRQPVATCDPF